MISGKVWGSTERVILTPLFEAHRLRIKSNSQCSTHVHTRKFNAFLIITGELFIDVIKNDYKLTDETRLGPGDMTTVPPGEYHRFRTGKQSCIAYEFYYLAPLAEDIIRKNCGGRAGRMAKLTGGLLDKGRRTALNPEGWYTCGCGQWINPRIGVPCPVCREARERKARKRRKKK